MDRGLPNNGHSGERVAENIPKLEEQHPQLEVSVFRCDNQIRPCQRKICWSQQRVCACWKTTFCVLPWCGKIKQREKWKWPPFREETHCSHCLEGCSLRQVLLYLFLVLSFILTAVIHPPQPPIPLMQRAKVGWHTPGIFLIGVLRWWQTFLKMRSGSVTQLF